VHLVRLALRAARARRLRCGGGVLETLEIDGGPMTFEVIDGI
jgi:hypothetical protein